MIHVVVAGETLVRIAERYGHSPFVIWKHLENEELRAARPNMNTLMPGDQLFIPDKDPGFCECATEQRHVFRRIGVPAILRVRLIVGGEPLAGVRCMVEIDGRRDRLMSDGDGVVELYVPPGAERGRIVAEVSESRIPFELRLGHLRPITEVAGVQDRLGNLGYLASAASGEVDEATSAAIAAFQRDAGLEGSGQLDQGTVDAIERAYATRERIRHAQ